MLRLLSDENFRGEILRGLRRRLPDVDVVRVQDVGLAGADDPAILAWAASEGRILVTHDRNTIPEFAYERMLIRNRATLSKLGIVAGGYIPFAGSISGEVQIPSILSARI